MNKARIDVSPTKLVINDGRIDWLPKNPRTWTKSDVDKMVASLERDPDFLEERPILVLPLDDGNYLVFCHNLCTTAAQRMGLKTVPCVIYFPETDEDRETVRRRTILDNGEFGSNDFDALANEWSDLPLTDLGMKVWNPESGDGKSNSRAASQKDVKAPEFSYDVRVKCHTTEEQLELIDRLTEEGYEAEAI